MLPHLDVSYFATQVFWLCIMFFTLYLLNYFLFIPMLSKNIIKRGNLIKEVINSTKDILMECRQYEEKIKNMRLDAYNEAHNIKIIAYKNAQKLVDTKVNSLSNNFVEFMKECDKYQDIESKKLQMELPKIIEELKEQFIKCIIQ